MKKNDTDQESENESKSTAELVQTQRRGSAREFITEI